MKFLKIIALLVVLVIGISVIARDWAAWAARQATTRRRAIGSPRSGRKVQVGMSESDVKAIVGKPDDTTHSESSDFEGGTDTYDSWMYGTLSGSTTYSVDFLNGVVESKTSI